MFTRTQMMDHLTRNAIPLLSLFLCVVYLQPFTAELVTVNTKYGALRGEMISTDNGNITRFLGVPYAQAPIKSYRFLRPRALLNWSLPRNATSFAPSCPQNMAKTYKQLGRFGDGYLKARVVHNVTNEDCLYLNMYIPGRVSEKKTLPVLVYIHDASEGWDSGFGMNFDGTRLALGQQLIVVNFNYRLGILGFLAAGNETHWGNYGMWDQVAALKWVHDNIHSFGGDNSRITIFGYGTGGISVGLLLLSNATNGLFKRAISQSGVALHLPEEKMKKMFYEHTAFFYKTLNCTSGNATLVLGCLQNVPLEVLMEASERYSAKINKGKPGGLFLPVVDGELIGDHPFRLLSSGKFHRGVPYMVGGVSGGTLRGFEQLSLKQIQNGTSKQEFSNLIQSSFSEGFGEEKATLQLISHEYNDERDDPIVLRELFLRLHSDNFWSSIYQTADFYSRFGDIYISIFSHKPSYSSYPDFVEAMPGEDILFAFGDVTDDALGLNCTLVEKFLSGSEIQPTIRMFASSNTSRDDFLGPWRPYTPLHRNYVKITTATNGDFLNTNYRRRAMRFWISIVPEVVALGNRKERVEVYVDPPGEILRVGELNLTAKEAHIALYVLGVSAGILLVLCVILLWIVCLLSFSCCQCCACCWYKDLPRGKGNRSVNHEIQTFDATNGVRNKYDSESSTTF
ncbi:liver carboxylesterase-like [Lingula anatina]|uniref:Liver carboxylesterase-like n=1 Tax=Lingula anatina TaxID=7574 RepID=A0A2R2MPP1_LINAN|nr:liver carboxylesterase-like [Lingula anatina]|eukprot:XP_023931982.1 liver carboxylesterase-like [Lingula anatina]